MFAESLLFSIQYVYDDAYLFVIFVCQGHAMKACVILVMVPFEYRFEFLRLKKKNKRETTRSRRRRRRGIKSK